MNRHLHPLTSQDGPTVAVPLLDDKVASTAALLRSAAPAPSAALLLGSGWGVAAESMSVDLRIPYADLPAFPAIGVSGHGDALWIGHLHGRRVAVLTGRRHTYEGGRTDAMLGAILSLAAWGVTTLIQTGAAGSLSATIRPGSLLLVEDHLNLAQASPLWSRQGDARFVDMTAAYDPELRSRALLDATMAGLSVHEGIYAWTVGPQFETPAEIRVLRALGGHAVGMSVVPETIAARYAGLKVMACALITNMAAGMGDSALTHALTLERAQVAQEASQLGLRILVQTAVSER